MLSSSLPANVRRATALVSLVFVASSAHATLVTFDSGVHSVVARDQDGQVSQQARTEQGPEALQITTQGANAQASTDVTLQSSADEAGLLLGFDHATSGGAPGVTYSQGYQLFRADADTQYSLSGFYELAGRGAVRLQVFLFDVAQGKFLLREDLFSVQGGRLDLGSSEDGVAGSLSAGGRYALWYRAFTFARPGSGEARGFGEVLLAIGGGAQAIAEPPMLGLLLAGLLAWVLPTGRSRTMCRPATAE